MATLIRRAAMAAALAFALAAASCGGGSSSSSPTTPTPTPTPLPGSSACGIISGQTAPGLAIVNGTACTASTASVALLYLVGSDGFQVGQCSGTVISPTAVLTAAHCLDEDVAKVRVNFGVKEFTAVSFKASPDFNGTASNSIDVGVVRMAEAMGQPVVPILGSRDPIVGETAVIAGYGQDLFGESRILRAGSTTIAQVGSVYLTNNYGGTAASTCAGDSGGPMLVSVNGTWTIAGVTSSVSGSCVAGSNYYVNVRNSTARAFILANAPDVTQK